MFNVLRHIIRPLNDTKWTLMMRQVSTNTLTKVSINNGIKEITMSNTKTRNALSIGMMKELVDNIEEGQDNPALRVIVIRAEGPVFSAGHNLKELAPETGKQQHEEVFKTAEILMSSIIESSLPIIACVDGLAAASGCQLVAQCDIAICTENSMFSTPGANFGLFCSTPGIPLARCVPKMTALHMLLTGLPITSNEAKENGLVFKVCSKEKLEEQLNKICDAIKAKSRSVIQLGKQFYYKQIQNDIITAYKLGSGVMVNNLQLRDGQEGIRSFIEKEKLYGPIHLIINKHCTDCRKQVQ